MSLSTTYLNTAAFGLIDPAVKAVADDFYTRLGTQGSPVSEEWRSDTEPGIRKTIAEFIGADAGQIAMLPNFSWGINAVVQSLTGKEKILLYKDDFPSLIEPFRLNKFDIRWIEAQDGFDLPLQELENIIRNREVDIVALSHVQFNSGYKLPIDTFGTLCSEYGVHLIIDATQSLGAMPVHLSASGIDILIASNYKWMNAGFGTAIMYIREDFLAKYPPVVGGFNSFTMQEGTWQHIQSARSYEPGHPNMYGLTLLAASIANIQQLNISHIEAHNTRLTRQLLEGISELGLPLIGPALSQYRASFILLHDHDGLSDRLRNGGFVVTNRGGRVRISMHHYNTEEDVSRLIAHLKQERIPK